MTKQELKDLNTFWQLFEYFYIKKHLTQVGNCFKFGEDFFNKIDRFTKVGEKRCPWRWLYTDENGAEYDEEQTFKLMESYFIGE